MTEDLTREILGTVRTLGAQAFRSIDADAAKSTEFVDELFAAVEEFIAPYAEQMTDAEYLMKYLTDLLRLIAKVLEMYDRLDDQDE